MVSESGLPRLNETNRFWAGLGRRVEVVRGGGGRAVDGRVEDEVWVVSFRGGPSTTDHSRESN